MATKKTRLFMSGNSQAVRIPREFQLDGDEVEIQRRGNTLVIRPKKLSWAPLMDSLKKFTADFMAQGRRQPAVQKRKRSSSLLPCSNGSFRIRSVTSGSPVSP
jgi:antitoxin VapB